MGFMLPSPTSPREKARALMSQKDDIEAELNAQVAILKANSCDLTSPLVDQDGFPRADVDLYAVRYARKRINELRNDLKDTMNEIGKVLEAVYDPSLAAPSTGAPPDPQVKSASDSLGSLKPFAKVNGVAPGSPASQADLRREDLILKFGHLTQGSFATSSLQPLADLVSANENRELQVTVLRSNETLILNFTPRQGWGGRGMLGCHILPFPST
ncbi:hypothetical protein BJ138DRAFT_1095245 [Hygrophoropsis aurantiaca]|uniref:Uncharacterized protein n=1 Tax=Hygrophoropsis aurantiaca TaxID=72124 RepID=A0ACB7ZWQ4_9AGAM|nr:hypothetical protein BJ138DRAFT_1095245 [Hygrophoropsis aurantiaca]